jgi:hypothetical protein
MALELRAVVKASVPQSHAETPQHGIRSTPRNDTSAERCGYEAPCENRVMAGCTMPLLKTLLPLAAIAGLLGIEAAIGNELFGIGDGEKRCDRPRRSWGTPMVGWMDVPLLKALLGIVLAISAIRLWRYRAEPVPP